MAQVAEFLDLLSDADGASLDALGRRVRADWPEVLIAQGDSADRVLILRAGRVKIAIAHAGGSDTVLTFRGPGALLGEQALLDQRPRGANVVAVEPVDVQVIAASAFRAHLTRHPSVAVAMLAMLSLRLRASDARLVEFARTDALGRVCARLSELCDIHGEIGAAGRVRITLPISQEELAGWTGASHESTARSLRSLRSLGWISTGRRTIEVHDLAALRQRAP